MHKKDAISSENRFYFFCQFFCFSFSRTSRAAACTGDDAMYYLLFATSLSPSLWVFIYPFEFDHSGYPLFLHVILFRSFEYFYVVFFAVLTRVSGGGYIYVIYTCNTNTSKTGSHGYRRWIDGDHLCRLPRVCSSLSLSFYENFRCCVSLRGRPSHVRRVSCNIQREAGMSSAGGWWDGMSMRTKPLLEHTVEMLLARSSDRDRRRRDSLPK